MEPKELTHTFRRRRKNKGPAEHGPQAPVGSNSCWHLYPTYNMEKQNSTTKKMGFEVQHWSLDLDFPTWLKLALQVSASPTAEGEKVCSQGHI